MLYFIEFGLSFICNMIFNTRRRHNAVLQRCRCRSLTTVQYGVHLLSPQNPEMFFKKKKKILKT